MWINDSNKNHSLQSCSLRNQGVAWLPSHFFKLLFKIKTIRKSIGQAIVSRFGAIFFLSEVTVLPSNLLRVSQLQSAPTSVYPPGSRSPSPALFHQGTHHRGCCPLILSRASMGSAISCSASYEQFQWRACPITDICSLWLEAWVLEPDCLGLNYGSIIY